ncbi:MAG: CDP-alcohol phosphatidyltransferase family protein [Myxococcales bacterium]|nr:CDP-alcohol phosphatidyltransferase family protein [Myxococcales bacterium]
MTPLLVWYGHVAAGAPRRPVSGLALARRAVLAAQAQGFDRIAVAVRHTDLLEVRAGLFRDRRIRADVSVVEVESAPSAAVAHLLRAGDPDVVVVLGDRVWTPRILAPLREPLAPGVAARTLVADPTDPDGHPSGLLRVRHELLDRLPLADGPTAGGLARAAGESGRVETVATGRHWHVVRTPEDTRAAETLLLQALRKPADGIVARHINRNLSLVLTRRLAHTAITPNQVSAVVLLIGLASGPFAALGSWLGFALGGLCYYLSSVLDGCDGELSRLKYLGSPLGAWVDTVVDDLVGLSFLSGLYLGLHRAAGHPWWLWIGVATVGAYALTIFPRYWLFVARIGVGDHQKLAADTRPADPRGLARLVLLLRDNIFRIDFLTFSAMVVCVAGVPAVFAASYAAGSVASLIDTVVTFRRFLRRP